MTLANKIQIKCIQQSKKTFLLPLVLFRFAFLVGGMTRGKAERVQTRKVWEIVKRNEGKPQGGKVDQPGHPLPPRKNPKKPQKKIF